MLPNANNNFTITHYTAPITAGADTVVVTLDNAVHPISRSVSVVANARGDDANMNVFVKSLSNSTGSWVITFGLSNVSDGVHFSDDVPPVQTSLTNIDYMVYSSVV